jgi:hypothetical protein
MKGDIWRCKVCGVHFTEGNNPRNLPVIRCISCLSQTVEKTNKASYNKWVEEHYKQFPEDRPKE